MDAHAWGAGKRRWHRSARKTDEIDLAVGGEGRRVAEHPRAAPQVSEYDNGGPHVSVYLLIALVSATLVAALTPLVSRVATALGLVDAPGGRKVHDRSVPRLGGVAVATAVVVAMILVEALGARALPDAHWDTVHPIAAATLLVFGLGLLDDVRGLGPGAKLGVQALAALVVMASGLLIERVTVLGVTWSLGWAAWPVTALWIVGLTNAFNLIDGIDGLAAGVAAIAGAACGAVLVARGHAAEAALLAAMAGAAVSFLLFNFPPASIFLGDAGSLVFGFALATTAIAGWQKGATALAAGVPLLIFALPIADLTTTLVRRVMAPAKDGRASLKSAFERLVEPDRQHIHHRLMELGWSARQAVLLLYLVTAALSVLALSTARVESP